MTSGSTTSRVACEPACHSPPETVGPPVGRQTAIALRSARDEPGCSIFIGRPQTVEALKKSWARKWETTGTSPVGQRTLISSCITRVEVDLELATISGVLPMSGDPTPRPFLQTSANEQNGKFSPDGRWVAFTSDESGREEVYVVPFPGPGGRSLISTEGRHESAMATGRHGDLLPQARHSDGRRRKRAGSGVSGWNRGPTLRGELPNGKLSGLRPRVGLRRRTRWSTFPDQRTWPPPSPHKRPLRL